MYFATIDPSSSPVIAFLYSAVAIIVGGGAIAFFIAKYKSGSGMGKEEGVQETIRNLTTLAESQRLGLEEQRRINSDNAKQIGTLRSEIVNLRSQIAQLQTIPLKQIADTLKEINSQIARQSQVLNYFFDNKDAFQGHKPQVSVEVHDNQA